MATRNNLQWTTSIRLALEQATSNMRLSPSEKHERHAMPDVTMHERAIEKGDQGNAMLEVTVLPTVLPIPASVGRHLRASQCQTSPQ